MEELEHPRGPVRHHHPEIRIQTPITHQPTVNPITSRAIIQSTGNSITSSQHQSVNVETGYNADSTRRYNTRLLLACLLSQKEKQRQISNDPQLGVLQRTVSCQTSTFSDDLSQNITTTNCSERLHDQPRLGGCIPPRSDTSPQSQISEIHLPKSTLSMAGSSVWNFHGPVAIYQNSQTNHGLSTQQEDQVRILHRRLHPQSSESGFTFEAERLHSQVTSPTRMDYQCQQVRPNSIPTADIYRRPISNRQEFDQSSTGQGPSNQTECSDGAVTSPHTPAMAVMSRPSNVGSRSDRFRTSTAQTDTDLHETLHSGESTERSYSATKSPQTVPRMVAARVERLYRSLTDKLRTDPSPVCRRVTSGVGRTSECRDNLRAVVRRVKRTPYKQLGIRSSDTSCQPLEEFSTTGTTDDTVRQFHSRVVYKQTGINPLTQPTQPDVQTFQPPGEHPCDSTRKTYPRSKKCPSRRPVQTDQTVPHGVDVTPRSLPYDMSASGYSQCRSVCDISQSSTTSLCVTSPRPQSLGIRRNVDIMGATQRIRLSPSHTVTKDSQEDNRHGQVTSDFGRALLASESLVRHTVRDRRSTSSKASRMAQHTSESHIRTVSSTTRNLRSSRLDCLQRSLRAKGYSKRAATAISQAHRKSTSSLYDDKWKSFQSFCRSRDKDPLTASSPLLADFFIHLRQERKLAGSTISTYLAAINSVLNLSKGKVSIKSPELFAMIRSFRLEDQKRKFKPPAWDLNLVLDSLRGPPYEPLDQASFENLTMKTCFLVALATAARVSEIHALDVTRVTFDQRRDGQVHLGLAWDFIAKNQQPGQPDRLFHIPPLSQIVGSEDECELMLCPVRSLKQFIHVSAQRRGSRQRLFIPVNQTVKGEISKNSISYWLKKTIMLAYTSKGLPPPTTNNPHEIRAVASTMALHSNISV